jgi:hypothetical protein
MCLVRLLRSVLPAVYAWAGPALLERDQALLPHRERRVEERFLVELRQRLLETRNGQTPAALAQHLGDSGLNGCGSAG